jgi:hypothetical protein
VNIVDVPDAGAVQVIYGSASGLSATTKPDQFWYQGAGGIGDPAEASDEFGHSLATGDFNNDGRDDLAIGVPGEGVNIVDVPDAGAVQVIYGSASGLSATTKPDQFWYQDSRNVNDGAEPGDVFGTQLSTGDFNNDGRDDLAIGVPGEDVVPSGGGSAVANAGAVNVIYGSSEGLRPTAVAAGNGRADQLWHQENIAVDDAVQANDFFGNSLDRCNCPGITVIL